MLHSEKQRVMCSWLVLLLICPKPHSLELAGHAFLIFLLNFVHEIVCWGAKFSWCGFPLLFLNGWSMKQRRRCVVVKDEAICGGSVLLYIARNGCHLRIQFLNIVPNRSSCSYH